MTKDRYKISADNYVIATMDFRQACDRAMEHIDQPDSQAAREKLSNQFEQMLLKLKKGESFTFHGLSAMAY